MALLSLSPPAMWYSQLWHSNSPLPLTLPAQQKPHFSHHHFWLESRVTDLPSTGVAGDRRKMSYEESEKESKKHGRSRNSESWKRWRSARVYLVVVLRALASPHS